ncbi:transmembrane protein, putative (macronuclear) [Tetrahymena thermophila SB210]|uniref:Transmembrane protein, putative n=1 Tax=Tetrahymena thermophila (strain SB210) TaxID=312017 RepID=W7XLJ6_TETTS|nr:transmembrane protein, putative [Tetrahymena thermophila SB210]EWS76404.1 transmembrane protein, putative [Tetrahymena thermophila SB210]|eukprot:XP_012651062.1 transmembrane protein, putative [Tetrahymena thermophila SB210]
MTIDVYTGFQQIITSFVNSIEYQEIKVYDQLIILQNNNQIILINTTTNEKFIKDYPKQFIKNAKFIKNDKLIYLYGNFFQILDTQLNVVQDISIDNQQQKDLDCTDFKLQIVCINIFISDFKEILVYNKIQNILKTIKIDNTNKIQYIFDEIYENIFIYQNEKNTPNQVRIYSSIGVLKQTIQKKVSDCMIFTIKIVCKLEIGLILIDRANLTFNQVLTEEDDLVKIIKFIYIGHLNYLLLQNDDDLSIIQIYGVSEGKIINQIKVNQNQLKNNNITYFQFDESQSRYVMLIDSQGTFYISSIDSNLPFQNFVNVCYSCDLTLFEFISYDSLSNNIYLRYSDSVFQLDYSSLGLEREPFLIEPFSLFTQIQINKLQTDYLILAKDNIVFRYSQNKLKFELSILKSDLLDIKYNQSSDVFILAFEDSLFFYQQYQSRINNNLKSVIYQLEMINFQQFIIDNVVITFDQKILHLDILTGSIIKIINFNITQIVTSFKVNDNKDLIIVGFSDGQLLQYNLTDQVLFLYNTSQKSPINISIITIQLIEISATQQFAYAASNGGLLFQIDTLNKKIISQIDLKVLVTEDPNISLSQFLIDQTYKRYIFCFNKQKKAYVYNYNNNQQELSLPLPKKYSTLGIIQNFLFIQCIFQINFYRLSAKIEFVSLIKKDFIQDIIIDFKLIENNILALFLIDRFELFIANGDKFNMIAQINSQYPRILSSQLDSEKNTFHILVLHKSGIFENSYNLNIYKSETISECSFFISIRNNRALIGGGLRIVQDDQSTLTLPQNFPFYENVFDNQAEIYGDDSTSYLQNIIIKNNDKINDELFTFYKHQSSVPINFQNEFSRYAELRQFRSGGLINFKIYIVDEQNRLLSFQKDKLILGLYPKDIAQELNNIQISIFQLSQNESQMFGQNIINYNEYDSQEFAFKINDLKITGNLNKIQFFYINSTIQTNSITKKPILLSIEFRNCKIGEIIQQINTNIYQCNQCLEGTYQIKDPQTLYRQSIEEKKDINQCINCPQSAISCKGDIILLKNGFWRQSSYTDEIIECDPIINSCQAENPNSINYCITGYLGPICQQCDILGEIWKGSRYSESLKRGVCGICESQLKQWVYMILKIVILEAYFLYVLGVFIKKFQYTQTCYYLRMWKIMPISSSSIQDYSGFYIKIILNYYQLSALLIPQPKTISINLNLFNDIIGSGGIQISLGIDCLMSEQNIRSLVSQISYFTKSLTCNQVGTQLYNPIDPSFDCYDTNVIKYLYPFSIMVLIFWSLLPLVFLKRINQNKNKLDQCLIKYKYGYYYGELKPKYYYWEFVRIYLKIIIIYLYTLLNNYNSIIAIITISAKTQLEMREKQQLKQRKTNPKKKVIKEANNKIYKQLSMGMDSSQQVLIRDQIQKPQLIN